MKEEQGPGVLALRTMRNTRRRNRIADIEWFEALYRVYITAIAGGGTVLFLSGLVSDEKINASGYTDLAQHGPAALGMFAAVVVFLGLRSGANGGPLAVEAPEVTIVLMSPVPYSRVLRHPAVQRLRTSAFMGALAGAVAGQLLSRRVDTGSFLTFAIAGAVYGACVGSLFISGALLAHGLKITRPIVTAIGTILLAWQAWVLTQSLAVGVGPFDSLGSIVLAEPVINFQRIITVLVVGAFAAWGVMLSSRLSLEALARRSSLVAQLHFAVTLQDLRTVVLLRRQLSQEHMRQKPWFRLRRRRWVPVVVRRGAHSLAHFPLRRIGRMAILIISATACQVTVFRGTTPAVIASGLLLFIFGLDIIEPLSQEVDQPDRTDSLPVHRGLLMTQHLIAPLLALIPFVLIGMATAYVFEPHPATLAMAALVGVPAALAGVAGAAINAVKGAPDPVGGAFEGLAMPPEMSGMTTMLRAVFPPLITIVGSVPIVAAKVARDNGQNVFAATTRASIGACIMVGFVVSWVHQRDAIHKWWRELLANSKTQTANRTRSS